MNNNILKILSCNCQGLNSLEKRRDVFDYLKSKNCSIYCLQDTQFTSKEEPFIRNQWGGECIFNSLSSNQRGVAIMFSKNLEYKIFQVKKDESGNVLGIDIEIEGKRLTLINIYGPNEDSPLFYESISKLITEYGNIILNFGLHYI